MKIMTFLLTALSLCAISAFSQNEHLLLPDAFYKTSNIYRSDNFQLPFESSNAFINTQYFDDVLTCSINEHADINFFLLNQYVPDEKIMEESPSDLFYEQQNGDLLYYIPSDIPLMPVYKPGKNVRYSLLIKDELN
jgi:hypothetical protein